MSLARRPEKPTRARLGARAELQAGRTGRARRPRAWPLATLASAPTPLPKFEGTPGSSLQSGADRGRRRSSRYPAALLSPSSPNGTPLPLACPQLPAAPSPHPTTPIKVHFGGESGLRLPLAPAGSSAHFTPRELWDPGGGGSSRAWRPLPPGAGWRSPRIELVGLLRRTFFSLRRPQHPARISFGSLRAGKSPGLTPSSPARSRLPRRGSGACGGAGWSRRERGGVAVRPVDKARGGVRRDVVGADGEGQGTRAGSPRSWAAPPARSPSRCLRERGGGHPGAASGLSRSCLGPRSAAAETQLRCGWNRCPGHRARGREALKAAVRGQAALGWARRFQPWEAAQRSARKDKSVGKEDPATSVGSWSRCCWSNSLLRGKQKGQKLLPTTQSCVGFKSQTLH